MTERSGSQALVAIDDEELLDEVLRLAAAADCAVDRVPDLVAARARWATAPVVLLDERALSGGAGALPVRRRGVFVVCAGPPVESTWRTALSAGVERVLSLPADEAALIAVLADAADLPAGGEGRVLAVLGGRGGGGASVFATAVALTASRTGSHALLLDCDGLGGGLDVLLGAEASGGVRWPGLRPHSGRIAMSALNDALVDRSVGPGRLVLLSCAREGSGPDPDAAAAVVEAGRRAGSTVVCDVSRHLDPTGRCVVGLADLVAVVVPAEVRACAAAREVVAQFGGQVRDAGVVVRGPAPDGLPAEVVAEAAGLPLLAVMRAEPRLDRDLDRGEFDPRPGGPLGTAARATLDALWSSAALRGAA